jgi:peroxiredoxin
MLAPGSRAPEILATELDGTQVAVSDLLAQGPVLVAFFKVSCPTCQYTLPFLQRMADQKGLTIIGISQDEAGPTRAFCKTYGVRFPVLLDAAGSKYPLSNAYKLRSVPSCFLIEPDGSISMAVQGFSRDDLAAIGHRFHTPPFRTNEDIPAFRPG